MIRVNLLPERRAARRRAGGRATHRVSLGGGTGVIVLVGMIAFGGAGYYGWTVYMKHKRAKEAIVSAQTKKDEVEKVVEELWEEVHGLEETDQLLHNELAALSALSPKDGVLWAEKLHQSAALVPSGVFFTRLDMTESDEEAQTPESIKAVKEWETGGMKGPKPPVVYNLRLWQELSMEGVIFSEQVEKRQDLLLDLWNRLRTFAEVRYGREGAGPIPFMRGLSDPTIGPYFKGDRDDVEVLLFSFTMSGGGMEL